MNIDILAIYQAIYESQGIHTLLLNPPFSNIPEADYGFRNHLFKNYDYGKFTILLNEVTDDLPVLIYKDEFATEYCLIQFPECFSEHYKATHYLIGPVIFQPTTEVEINMILEKNGLPKNLYNDFLEFFNRIPSLPSRDFWISLILPLLNTMFDGNVQTHYLEFNEGFNGEFELNESEFSLEAIENRYKAEHQLLEAVQMGNLDKAISYYQRFQLFKLAPRTSDSLRSRKNLLLTLNTLLRKSIEYSHVHPYYIDKIFSEFSIRIEDTASLNQLESLSLQMIRKYCMLVKNYSTRNLSSLVEKCVHQIHFHYAEPLSLEILAEANAVSTSYLSALFHKETGSTITTFINETRVNRSLLLLNTTSLSIGEIASQCGFTDANYYTRIFKKMKGITPMAYRKSMNKN